jgi:hypothetical protein
MDDWDVPRLVDHLNSHGLHLRATPTSRNGSTTDVAYLTETDRNWEELNRLMATRDTLGEWQGVVYCERVGPNVAGDVRIELWGDACLEAPPFLFFGDRDLLARIDGALRNGEGRS